MRCKSGRIQWYHFWQPGGKSGRARQQKGTRGTSTAPPVRVPRVSARRNSADGGFGAAAKSHFPLPHSPRLFLLSGSATLGAPPCKPLPGRPSQTQRHRLAHGPSSACQCIDINGIFCLTFFLLLRKGRPMWPGCLLAVLGCGASAPGRPHRSFFGKAFPQV